MIRDTRTTFASAVALNTGGAGSYIIGDVVDLSITGRNIGAGVPPLFFIVIVSTTATSGGSATGQFSLVTSDSSNLSSATVIASGAAIAVASLTAGTVAFVVALPPGVYKRYIGLQQTTGTAAFTAGAVNAFLAEDVNAIVAYAQAFS